MPLQKFASPHFFTCRKRHTSALTHRSKDIFAALLVLLLNSLLQEVDAQLEAEVLLLQVVQVLRQSAVAVRHDRQRAPTRLDMSGTGQKKKTSSSVSPCHAMPKNMCLFSSGLVLETNVAPVGPHTPH